MAVPTLSTLPWFVKENIVKKTDFLTRNSLRKCSKEFQKLALSSTIFYKHLWIELKNGGFNLGMEQITPENKSFSVEFRTAENGYILRRTSHQDQHFPDGPMYLEKGMLELMKILQDSQTFVREIYLEAPDYATPLNQSTDEQKLELRALFKTHFSRAQGPLNVRKLGFHLEMNQEELFEILAKLTPGFLKRIEFTLADSMDPLERITEMEQFQQAQRLEVHHWDNIPYTQLTHFRKVHMNSKGPVMSFEQWTTLINALLLQGPNFKTFGCFFKQEHYKVYCGYVKRMRDWEDGTQENEKFITVEGTKFRVFVWPNLIYRIENVAFVSYLN